MSVSSFSDALETYPDAFKTEPSLVAALALSKLAVRLASAHSFFDTCKMSAKIAEEKSAAANKAMDEAEEQVVKLQYAIEQHYREIYDEMCMVKNVD